MVSEAMFQVCNTWKRDQFELCTSSHQDDAIPQWGCFQGVKSVVLLGINPGGDSGNSRNSTDEIVLPLWEDFQRAPTQENFVRAQMVHMKQLQRTKYWSQHVAPVLEALNLQPESVTMCNCIPFRTPNTRWPAATRRAATRHVRQMLDAIDPSRIVAMGKLAADISQKAGRRPDFVWNRGRRTEMHNSDRAKTLQDMRNFRSRF